MNKIIITSLLAIASSTQAAELTANMPPAEYKALEAQLDAIPVFKKLIESYKNTEVKAIGDKCINDAHKKINGDAIADEKQARTLLIAELDAQIVELRACNDAKFLPYKNAWIALAMERKRQASEAASTNKEAPSVAKTTATYQSMNKIYEQLQNSTAGK